MLRFPLIVSLSTDSAKPVDSASCFCVIPRPRSSSFISSPGCVAARGIVSFLFMFSGSCVKIARFSNYSQKCESAKHDFFNSDLSGDGLMPRMKVLLPVTAAACPPLQQRLCSGTLRFALQAYLAWPAFLCARAATSSPLPPSQERLTPSHRRLPLAPVATPFMRRHNSARRYNSFSVTPAVKNS